MSKTRKVKRAAHKPNPSRSGKNGKRHGKARSSPASRPAARSPPHAPPAAAPTMSRMAAALAAASAEVEEVQVKSGASAGTEPPAFEVRKAGGAPVSFAPAEHSPSHGASVRHAPPAPPARPTVPTRPANNNADDERDNEPVMVVKGGGATKAQAIGDGVQVASKGPAKFSMEDLEALRKAIVIKGSGRIVAGINLDELKYDQEGLVAVVTQDRATGAVLMQAFANKEALEKSLTTNEMTYFSRQRNKLWTKGEESGNTQKLIHLKVDCDKDAVLAVVEQTGVACHRETGTCFNDDRTLPVAGFLGELDAIIAQRNKDRPEDAYTTKLLEDPSLAAGKIVEEAKEVATVLKGKPNKDTLQHEAADVLFHLLVACRGKGVGLREIVGELLARHKKEDAKPAKK